jgi:hypothetical protein
VPVGLGAGGGEQRVDPGHLCAGLGRELLGLGEPVGRPGAHAGDPRVGAGTRRDADELGRELLGDRHVGDLGHPRHQRRGAGAHDLQPFAGGRPLGGQPVLDAGEAAHVEQRLEQPPAVLGLGPQEPGEVALRKQHHLAELLGRQPEPVAQVL